MNIYTLSNDIYITIDTNIKIYDYEQFSALCREHIKTDKYYKILNDGNIIYTTLYCDRFENSIQIGYLTIIFLSYDVEEVEDVVRKSFYSIPNKYKSDREIAKKILLWCCYAIKNLDQKFSNDKELIMMIIKNQRIGHILRVLSDELRDDKEIVLLCVKYNGYHLKYASERLKGDKEVVMVAIENDKYAIKNASKELQDDPEIIKLLLGMNIINYLKYYFH